VEALSNDRNPHVRGTAAHALGELGEPTTRAALEQASRDSNSFVREQAVAALRRIAPPPSAGRHVLVSVGQMGDRTGRASESQRNRMRELMVSRLRAYPSVQLTDATSGDRGIIIDGSIKSLSISDSGGGPVEATCEVQLIVSTSSSHNILLMTSGEATVQTERADYRSSQREAMLNDAIDNAIVATEQKLAPLLVPNRGRTALHH
jgi:hypothetical protein